MIQSITLSNLRNGEFNQFMIHLLRVVSNSDPAVLKVQEQYDVLSASSAALSAMIKTEKGSDLTSDMQQADVRRDRCISGLGLLINALTYHPDETLRAQAATVQKALDKYGTGISRQNYNAETNTISSILGEFADAGLAAAATALGLDPWLTELQTSNKEFDDLFVARTLDKGNVSEETVREKRKEMNEQYFELRDFLNSYYTVTKGATPYGEAVKQINLFIAEYNTLIDQRSGSSLADDTQEEEAAE